MSGQGNDSQNYITATFAVNGEKAVIDTSKLKGMAKTSLDDMLKHPDIVAPQNGHTYSITFRENAEKDGGIFFSKVRDDDMRRLKKDAEIPASLKQYIVS